MNRRCLYCAEPLPDVHPSDFHEKCCLDFFGTNVSPTFPYNLEEMADLAKKTLERSISVPGVQPKLSLSLVEEALGASRLTVVGALGGNYIFKPPTERFPELPANEHITMLMARVFGIETVKSSLIRMSSGELSYITRRIDRTDSGKKTHMLDFFQILEGVDKYKSSMEKIGKGLASYSANTLLDLLRLFEITLFSYLTGNNDMHLKNFSMIRKDNNDWVLSPAYDLLNVTIANPEDKEELALTMGGKKNRLKKENFLKFGQGLRLNDRQLNGVFRRVIKHKPDALSCIDKSFLSTEMKSAYKTLLWERYGTIES